MYFLRAIPKLEFAKVVLNCNRLQKFARDRLLYAIDGVLTNFSSIGHVLEGCLKIGPLGQMRTGAHIRARGRARQIFFLAKITNFDFAPYMKSKFSIHLSTTPKSGAADSVLTLKIDFENI